MDGQPTKGGAAALFKSRAGGLRTLGRGLSGSCVPKMCLWVAGKGQTVFGERARTSVSVCMLGGELSLGGSGKLWMGAAGCRYGSEVGWGYGIG